MRRRPHLILAGVLALALLGAACSGDDDDGSAAPEGGDTTSEPGPTGPGCSAVPAEGPGSLETIADEPLATAASQLRPLSILVNAVGESDLVDTLNDGGPFTVFAPVDAAFAKLPTGDLDALLADKEALADVLTYHVVDGEMTTDDLVEAGEVETLQGAPVTIDGRDELFVVNGAEVLCAEVQVGNATVYLIDEVLNPDGDITRTSGPTGPACSALPAEGPGSLAAIAGQPAATAASEVPLLSTLATAVDAAGLVDTLNGDGPFTVFAPVDDAFGVLPQQALADLLEDPEALADVLTYHVAPERLSSAELVAAGEVETVQGGTVEIGRDGSDLTVNGATVLCAEVPTANATIYLIDSVLMPA